MRTLSKFLPTLACGLALSLSACGDEPDELIDEPTAVEEPEADEFRALSEDPLIRSKQLTDMIIQTVEQTAEAELPYVISQVNALIQQVPFAELTPAERQEVADYWESASVGIEAQLIALASYNEYPGLGEFNGFGCYTRCAFFLEYACENSQFVGICAGFWGCAQGIGVHECYDITVPSGETCGGEVCQPGWRCAHWAFKPDECVKECVDNSDCPGSQQCKKPFGTSFKRCV